jgi:hypothetical protein
MQRVLCTESVVEAELLESVSEYEKGGEVLAKLLSGRGSKLSRG